MAETLCPVCRTNPARIHQLYGVLPCLDCNSRRSNNSLPDLQPEMVGLDIQNQRKENARSIIQPYRSGQLSKEYLELYGTKNIKPSKEEIAKAENVWTDVYSDNFDIKKTK